VLIAGVTFYLSNFWLNGTLNNERKLGNELKSPPDSLYTWKIASEAPFKYRALHRIIVAGTYHLVEGKVQNQNRAFFIIYKLEAFVFHCFAILLFYYFLVKINLSETALAGAILFAFLPPLLFAYNMPIHTREDTLAYCLLILGLSAIINNSVSQIILLTILGVLCRETLLLIPFVNLFYNKKQGIAARLLIACMAFGVFICIRLYYGIEKYDYWEGLRWNSNNIEQIVSFGYASFGFLWVIFLWSFANKKPEASTNQVIHQSRIPVFFLVVLTTFVGGIFNEIRLLYLLAPWIIPIALQFYSNHKLEIVSTLKSKRFQTYAILLLMIMTVATAYAQSIVAKHFVSKFEIPYAMWIGVFAFQVYAGLLCLPYFYQITKQS
jgi:hypothetical protein